MNKQPCKVFDTNYASREEIDGVLDSLHEAGIEVFEIEGNKLWGGGAICVKDAENITRARSVIDDFQLKWKQNAQDTLLVTKVNWTMAIPIILILALFLFTTLMTIL